MNKGLLISLEVTLPDVLYVDLPLSIPFHQESTNIQIPPNRYAEQK